MTLAHRISDRVVVTINNNIAADVTAPVVSPPADITLEGTAILTPVDIGLATTVDNLEGFVTGNP